MNKKKSSAYRCINCGTVYKQWSGKCGSCGEWNSLTEEDATVIATSEPAVIVPLKSVNIEESKRIKTGIDEFDRVLGGDVGGIVSGSVVLIAGSPGIGKSTLLMQMCANIQGCVYFSAEESSAQLKIRSLRLAVKDSQLISTERNLSSILSAVSKEGIKLVVIDSIQTIYDPTLPGAPGSVLQVREACWRIQQFAKEKSVAFVIVGHITKDGNVAGPKTLEHLVDAVLYFEGEKSTGLRLLRGEKNRYAPTTEIGIFQMSDKGFVGVVDPGTLFTQMLGETLPGRALTVAVEGTRAFLLEVQALVTKNTHGYQKRITSGIDQNRLLILLAVLSNRLQIPLNDYDVYLNVVGGANLKDPGIDLAVAAAILSSYTDKAMPEKAVLFGEVGLLGEVRPASKQEIRIRESKRLKYSPVSTKSLNNLLKLFATKAA